MNKALRDRLKLPGNPLKLSEAQMQRAIFAELRLRESQLSPLRHVIHIPNEGKRSTIGGKLAKDGGLNAGVPDIMPAIAYGMPWALELKSGDNQPTPAQSWWINEYVKADVPIGLAYSIEESIDFILYQYIKTPAPMAAWRAAEWLKHLAESGTPIIDPRQADEDKKRAW